MNEITDIPVATALDDLETLKEYEFTDAEWQLANMFDDKSVALTIKNIGSTPVSVFCINDPLVDLGNIDQYLQDNSIDPVEIGGVTYEVSSVVNDKMFIKAPLGTGKVSIRIYGTVDPTADLSELAKMITQLSIMLDTHEKNQQNIHEVNKDQVELGNIPNAITNDPVDPNYDIDTDQEVLVTLHALRIVLDLIVNHIETIEGNPHNVTKNDVVLGNVANYPPADALGAIDETKNDVYLTPWSGALLVKDLIQIVYSIRPQTVVAGAVAPRLPGWSLYDITVPSNLIDLTGDRSMRIKSGLQVAYAYHGKTLLSKVLLTDIICNFPPSNSNGIWYVYVNLDSKGNFTGWGTTQKTPETGTYMEAHSGDFFNTATCEMFDDYSKPCIRVYIGKVYFSSNIITQVISVPFGDTAIIPITSSLMLGKSALIANPFIDKVETTALVEYGAKWGETKWNDQIGVLATPRPKDEYNNILVQVGTVGYLACGANAGSPFGESFPTVTVAPRMAIKIKKA